MDKIMVSVIMPVYNSEEYLETAIKSVLNQKMEEMELLLIDDGSKDRSGSICDQYESDWRVRVFHKQNEGICATRNFGVDHARGEYLMFIDNDDELTENTVEDNYRLAKQYNADVVKFGCSIEESFKSGFVEKRANRFRQLAVFSREEAASHYAMAERDRYFSYIWNGMYRTNWWREEKPQFDTSIKCGFEDRVLNYKIFEKAQKQVFNPGIGYRYFQRYEHSTFKRFNRNMLYSCLLSAEAEFRLFEVLKNDQGFQGDWVRKSAEYLIEFLLLLSREDNDMSKEELADFMKKLRVSRAFRSIQKKGIGKNLALTKRMVVSLFAQRRYRALLGFAKVYLKFIYLKRRLGKH